MTSENWDFFTNVFIFRLIYIRRILCLTFFFQKLESSESSSELLQTDSTPGSGFTVRYWIRIYCQVLDQDLLSGIGSGCFSFERNWVFATDYYFRFPTSEQPDGINLWYFKLGSFDWTELISLNIYGLHQQVAKI